MTGEPGSPDPTLRHWPAVWLALLLLGTIALAQVNARSDRTGESTSNSELLSTGAEVYADHCSVCHGATGRGLAEAREAFPPDHRRCQRCHKPGNPPTMNLAQVEQRQHDLFDVGDPPPLTGEDALAANAAPQAIRAYLEAAMPRYRPGTLSSLEYEALTAFLLQMNDR